MSKETKQTPKQQARQLYPKAICRRVDHWAGLMFAIYEKDAAGEPLIVRQTAKRAWVDLVYKVTRK